MTRDPDQFDDAPDDPTPEVDPKRTDGPNRLGVTSRQNIIVAVLSGGVVGYLLLATLDLTGAVPPLVPWSLVVVLLATALPTFWFASRMKKAVAAGPVDAATGVRALGLGKSMLFTGAILVGGHLVYVATWLGHLDIPGPRERVIHGSATIVAAAVFALAGWRLERSCIADHGDDDEGHENPDTTPRLP